MEPAKSLIAQLQPQLEQLDGDRRQGIIEALRESTDQFEMWMTDDDRGRRRVPISLRPTMVDPALEGYMHHVTWQMRRAMQRLVAIVSTDQRAADILTLTDQEQAWFARYQAEDPEFDTRFCRLDALFRPGAGEQPEQLQFIEPNVVGLGGMCYARDTIDMLSQHVFPQVCDTPSSRWAQPGDDPRELLFRELVDFRDYRQLPTDRPVVLVGSRKGWETDGEDRRLIEWLRNRGLDAVFADPEELDVDADGQVLAEGQPISFIFRTMELSDLVEREEKSGPLRAMRAAFDQGLVIPTVGGDLEQKSVFELFTSEEFAHHFTPKQQRLFDRHVLWTRMLTDRKTTSPDGGTVQLPEFAERHRDELVLKPNRSYGGEGVMIGPDTDASDWRDAIERGLSGTSELVVQELAPLVRESLPVTNGESLELSSVYTVVGIFPSRHGVGLLGRFSDESVVNITRVGGVLPVMIDFS